MPLKIEGFGLIGDSQPQRWSETTDRSTGSVCRGSIRRPVLPQPSEVPNTADGGCATRQGRGTSATLCGIVVRVVDGLRGEVEVDLELMIRFDYGSIVPWVQRRDGMLQAIGGPDALALWSPVEMHGEDAITRAVREWWQEWCAQCTYNGPYRTPVLRSLMVLKCLTFAPTGGIERRRRRRFPS